MPLELRVAQAIRQEVGMELCAAALPPAELPEAPQLRASRWEPLRAAWAVQEQPGAWGAPPVAWARVA